jgi:MFS family permease
MDLVPSNPAPDAVQPPEVVPYASGASRLPAARPPVGRRALMLRAFAHPNYRLFFAGQLVSLCGTFLSSVAVVWLVYHLTGDPWWLGVVGFAGQLPLFLVTPFAGVWVDRIDRRRLLVATQVLSMLQSVALGVLVWTDAVYQPGVGVLAIAALAAAQGLINAFDMPARQAFLVEMVTDRADLPNAIALNSTMVHSARLVGPALAGFLVYWVGPALCFLLDGASYLAVIASLLAMKVTPRPRPPAGRGVRHELREGLTYAWNHRPIRALLLLMATLSLAGMPAFSTLVPVFAHHFGRDGNDSQYLGFLMAASGLGALVGALQLAGRRSVAGLGRVISVAAFLFGASLVAFGFSRSLWVALLIVPFAGYAMLMNFASSNTLLQTLADEDKRGRVMSLFTVAFIGMTPFGNLLAGGLAAAFAGRATATATAAPGLDANLVGASMTLWVCGGICLAAAAVFAWRLPSLRRHTREAYADRVPARA